MNKTTLTFFEEINFGSVERMHSEIIRWILSGEFPEIQGKELKKFYDNFLRIKNIDLPIVFAGNEIDNMDILIKTEKMVIIIENKLKSSEHSDQLLKYTGAIEEKYKDQKSIFFFLTLIDEKPSQKGWKHITYKNLLNALNKLSKKTKQHYIIQNYINYIEKIVRIHQEFLDNPKKYSEIFQHSTLTKEKKIELLKGKTDDEAFLVKNNLGTIFQKSHLHQLISLILKNEDIQIDGSVHISETHGKALVDIIIERDISHKQGTFDILVQLQGKSLKFMFSKQYYHTSNKKEIEEIIPIFKEISKKNSSRNDSYSRLNLPKTKASISLSKQLPDEYWNLEQDTLKQYITQGIKEAQKLVENLVQKIKKID